MLPLWDDLMLTMGIELLKIEGDAADSPIVKNTNQQSNHIGIMYTFKLEGCVV